nr:hypothetical protein CFP56_20546 [Quercus suber]
MISRPLKYRGSWSLPRLPERHRGRPYCDCEVFRSAAKSMRCHGKVRVQTCAGACRSAVAAMFEVSLSLQATTRSQPWRGPLRLTTDLAAGTRLRLSSSLPGPSRSSCTRDTYL